MDYGIQNRRRGLLAAAFFACSALTLISCRDMAAQIDTRIGIPSEMVSGAAMLAGILTPLLILGALSGCAATLCRLLAHAYTCLASMLTQAAVIVTFLEHQGFTRQSITLALTFIALYVATIFVVYRLVDAGQAARKLAPPMVS